MPIDPKFKEHYIHIPIRYNNLYNVMFLSRWKSLSHMPSLKTLKQTEPLAV